MAIVLPQIIAGDTNVLLNVIKSHHMGTKKFASLRSRYDSKFLYVLIYHVPVTVLI